MNRSTRAAAAALALAATAALGGCAIIAPTAPVRTPSAIEACAQGTTWSLDMAALQTQVYELRALVDRPFASPLIQSVRGVGYRLVAPA